MNIFSPAVLVFFALLMLSLLVLHAYVSGTRKAIVAITLQVLSVFGFFAFLFYFYAYLSGSCSPEVTRTLVISTIIFVLSCGLFFYYSGRKRI